MGLPMCITERRGTPAGHAWAHGRGESRLVNTALVGDCAPGEWVLVFLDSAQERLSTERAAEIDATLDLVAAAMRGHELTNTEAAFVLPSAMDAAQLAALTGQTP
jgi:hydrogenase expression/formation protein HypC